MGNAPETRRISGSGAARRLRALFALPSGDPELAVSQHAALSHQIPLLYGILMVNAVALAWTHARTAPPALTWDVPAMLFLVCTLRGITWVRSRGRVITGAEALRQLRWTMLAVVPLGIAFTVWSLTLYKYGDAYAQCHVAFYMAITVISCIFCLMHLRGAALLLTGIVVPPFTVFFLLSGRPVLIALAINMALVTIGMVYVLLRNYRDFTDLIVSRGELMHRQRETQRLSDENFRLANIDSLTSLPNRRRFFSELETTLKRAGQEGRCCAVALLDLDRFKSVNDVHGHAAGDRLLTQVGERLKRMTAENMFVARLGGDEFGAIFIDCPSDEVIVQFGAEVKTQLQNPCVVGDRLATISCSIGVAIYPRAGDTAELLFERADYALFHGKQHCRGELIVFSDEHETVIRQSGIIEQAFRAADFDAEMWLAFQPIVDSASRRVVAYEALARWTSPELGAVGPDVFIPVAERARLISQLTATLLRKALVAALHWPPTVSLCFNLSAQDLAAPDTMAALCAIVAGSGVPPQRIEFEVTETALLSNFEQAAAMIERLHGLGVRVALDDFGTGFSSLGYVHRLKLDKIKVDRSFVTDVDTSRTSQSIIKSILALCDNVNLTCIVEGVESDSQLRALVALGCRFFQGYLFSRPVPGHAVARVTEEIANSDQVPCKSVTPRGNRVECAVMTK